MTVLLTCEKCGNDLIPGDLRCKICDHFNGRECKSCGRHVPSGERVCDICGFDLGPEFPFSGLSQEPPALPTQAVTEPAQVAPEPTAPEPEPAAAPPVAEVGHQPTGAVTKPLPQAEIQEPPPVERPVVPPSPQPTKEARPQTPPPLPTSGRAPGPRDEPKRLDSQDYRSVQTACKQLIKARTDLFGVFGRPEAGKTFFIYALGKYLKGWHGAEEGSGNYALDKNWEDLIHYQERLMSEGIKRGTSRGLHFYQGKAIGRGRRKRHIALIDIRGEDFEQIDDWNAEITDFFLTYLTHIKGLFLFLDLDPDAAARNVNEVWDRREREKGAPLDEGERDRYRQAWRFKREQMSHMVKFLSVLATVPKIRSEAQFEAQRDAINQAHRADKFGQKQVKLPVCLCIAKADLMKDYHFEGYPTVVPGSHDFLGDPWNAVEAFFPKEMEQLLQLVPRLKVEWVSSTGENFRPERGAGQPLGLGGAFSHVIGDPPPGWAMSSAFYRRWPRLFGLGKGGSP